jgi:hypothetical protein
VENEKYNFKNVPRLRVTCGEILPNGEILDLVESDSGNRVELVRWDGTNYEIGPQFQAGSTIYQAPRLHPSLLDATRFAPRPAEYGDALKLFWKIVDLFRRHIGLSREHAVFMVRVAFSSWFPDCSARPVTVCISGLMMDQIMKLFRLFHVVGRRAFMVAQLSTNLPLFLRPTLLINVPRVTPRTGEFWTASNYRGTVIPGSRGTMCNISCSKIIYCATEAAGRVWAPEAIHIALPPMSQEFPSLTELEEAQLAAEYQPQLLMFRLRNLSSSRQPILSAPQSTLGRLSLVGYLPACIDEDPEIAEAVTPLVDAHDQEMRAWRARDPHLAIVEAIWSAAHKKREISTAEITGRVNALLRKRGEILRYNSQEIGWKLRKLGLSRQSNGKCKVVRFSHEKRRQIHQLAARFGLQLPKIADCEDCKRTQPIEQE